MENIEELLDSIPTAPQRQDSTTSQLKDLIRVAEKLGMYDAADYIKDQLHDPFEENDFRYS